MFNKKLYLFILIFLCAAGKVNGAEGGYFNVQSGSEYLGFANMNKEFKITSLMNSAIANDFKATKIFITSGSNVNEVNIANVSALHLAARNYAFESAKVLIESGANVNAKDSEGWTPLMRASLNSDEKLMKLLLENGASIWTKNIFGDTALVHAAMADCYECGKLLLDNANSKRGSTKDQIRKALDITRKRYNEPFIELLTEHLSSGELLILSSSTKPISIVDNENLLATGESITIIIYNFLGKTINASELDELNKSVKSKTEKKQLKLVHQDKKDMEEEKMMKSFDFAGRKESHIALENDLKQESLQNNKIIESTKKTADTKPPQTKFVFEKGEMKAEQNLGISENSAPKPVFPTKVVDDKNTKTAPETTFTLEKGKEPIKKEESINIPKTSGGKDTNATTNEKRDLENKSMYKLNSDTKTLSTPKKEKISIVFEDKQTDSQNKQPYKLNNDVKTINLQKNEINNVVEEDKTLNKNYNLKPAQKSIQNNSQSTYNLQNDDRTLNK